MLNRKWKPKYKWRHYVAISNEMVQEMPNIVNQVIRDGYTYNKGFKAVSHRAGINNDDFVQNRITVVFFSIKVPRICKR